MWRLSSPVASMAARLRSGSSPATRAIRTVERSREVNAPFKKPFLCVGHRREMWHLSQLQQLAQVAPVVEDRDDASVVHAEELAEGRDRKELLLREFLRAVLCTVWGQTLARHHHRLLRDLHWRL